MFSNSIHFLTVRSNCLTHNCWATVTPNNLSIFLFRDLPRPPWPSRALRWPIQWRNKPQSQQTHVVSGNTFNSPETNPRIPFKPSFRILNTNSYPQWEFIYEKRKKKIPNTFNLIDTVVFLWKRLQPMLYSSTWENAVAYGMTRGRAVTSPSSSSWEPHLIPLWCHATVSDLHRFLSIPQWMHSKTGKQHDLLPSSTHKWNIVELSPKTTEKFTNRQSI